MATGRAAAPSQQVFYPQTENISRFTGQRLYFKKAAKSIT
jgi:hypothetical protein